MISREADLLLVRTALRRSRVVALLGPRQCGKTTLAREFVASESLNYFDLEDIRGLARLLRVLADRRPLPARFLILGSASPDLLRQSAETLAGRLETVLLGGFRLADLGADKQARHWLRGGFPLSYTARTEADSAAWRRQFLQTFLERDVPQLGVSILAIALHRFWNMIAQAPREKAMRSRK